MSRDGWEALALWAKVAVGAASAAWVSISAMTQALLWLMAADLALGIMGSFIARTVSPDVCWRGLLKKAMTLMLVGVCAALEPVTGAPLGQAAAGFYAAHELLSVAQNAERAGLPVPQIIRAAMARLSPEPPAGEQKGGGTP